MLPVVRSTGGNKHIELVDRDFNAAINIRRLVALKTRPAALTRSNFAGQPLRLEMCLDILKLIAGGEAKRLDVVCD